jgi:hypothetical protein
MDLWLPGYWQTPVRRPQSSITDVLFTICDHFEPLHDTNRSGALERVARWQREYPRRIQQWRDADGKAPRHTFFYPVEQYDPEILKRLNDLCRGTESEIEVHLHHDYDTPVGLRDKLNQGAAALGEYGALARDSSGRLRFGFIHGNWALADSHPDGRHCGVPEELTILKEAGCYADFTLPSAPDRTQSRIVNQIYYATSNGRPKPHDDGVRARVKEGVSEFALTGDAAEGFPGDLLLVQGPLGFNWRSRKLGVVPRVENGEVSGTNPPRADRLRIWLRLGIHVSGQPDWIFIKLHTHGGIPENMQTLLGDPMTRFYEHLLQSCTPENGYRVHFVTAREMVNIIHAAEDGHRDNPGAYRDYRYRSNLRAPVT